MQQLDLVSLVQLASTCKMMGVGALHREAGKFVTLPKLKKGAKSLSASLGVPHQYTGAHPEQNSALFRAHVPMTLSLPALDETPIANAKAQKEERTAAQSEELLQRARGFSRITQLRIDRGFRFDECNTPAAEERAWQLLKQPWMQRIEEVNGVDTRSMWVKSERLQKALFALPRLAKMEMSMCGPVHFLPSALAQAALLREVDCSCSENRLRHVLDLLAVPQLERLTMAAMDEEFPDISSYFHKLSTDFKFPHLKELRIRGCDMTQIPRAQMRSFLLGVPKLETLEVSLGDIFPVLQGLLDAGTPALPNLRSVSWTIAVAEPLDSKKKLAQRTRLMRRFLHRFPLIAPLHIDFWVEVDDVIPAYEAAFSHWSRIDFKGDAHAMERMDAYEKAKARLAKARAKQPSPHASDDEDELVPQQKAPKEEDSNSDAAEKRRNQRYGWGGL